MNNTIGAIAFLFLFSYVTSVTKHAFAQPIIPASDGTNTVVTPEGTQFNIDGGQLSENGANLFHSFEQFGLDAGQAANFLSNPDIQNILGRVTGGNASIINGLIQVTGGNSNLYLMNPAGILFGANASLNVPGDFFATSATGIGFGEGNWFNAIGENNWANLVGTPSQFAFSSRSPGIIVNFGNLTLEPGQNLTLMGGSVLNSGTLSTPGGKITLAALPGESLVRISQENHLLSLEVATGMGEMRNFTPDSLPELLTGAGATHAETVTVNPNGSIQLSGSEIRLDSQTGDAIASGEIAAAGGQIAVLGHRVAVINADMDASGINGGGTILIGGDLRGKGTVPNALQTFIGNDATIAADATEFGDGGRVIIFAEETAHIYGQISARGGIFGGNGGFIETSGLQFLEVATIPNASTSCTNIPACGIGGEWLIDPNNIAIVAGAGNVNINDMNPFAATGDTAQLGVNLIVAALTGGNQLVTIETGGDGVEEGNITVAAPIDFNGTSLDNTLTLKAHNNININADITDSIPGGDSLNLVLNGDIDNANGGGIAITNVTINTGGGDFTATGTGSATLIEGININDAIINAGGGNISLTGTGWNGVENNDGISIIQSVLETRQDGTITLEGIGGNGTDSNTGIFITTDTTVRAEHGNIILSGQGNGTGELNAGVTLQNGSIVESTSGAIAIEGFGSNNGTTTNNFGISFFEATVRSNEGNIQIIGNSGTGEYSDGIIIRSNSTVETGGMGTISLRGIVNSNGMEENDGIFIENSTIQSQQGKIDFFGTGKGTGISNSGIDLVNSNITSTSGAIAIAGEGGTGTNQNEGIFINNTTIKSENGDIALAGRGNGTGTLNLGISVRNGSEIFAEIMGNITLQGMGANNQIDNNDGIFIDRASIASFNGTIKLIGTALGRGNLNEGIYLQNDSQILSTGTGRITLKGTGGDGVDNNDGIVLDNTTVRSRDGNIEITGRSNGTGNLNEGVYFLNGTVIESTRLGTIALIGIGGNGLDNNDGFVANNARMRSISGITIEGVSNGTREHNQGVILENGTQVQSTGGAISVTGRGGNGTQDNHGILLDDRIVISSITGAIALNGTGKGTGINNVGINLQAGSEIESTGTGNVTLEGVGANNTEGIWLQSSFINPTGTGTGNVTLQGNDMRLTGESRISTNGTLTLAPIAANSTIGINDAAGDYNLTTQELLMLDVGSGNVTLGSATGGHIYVGSLREIDLSTANYNLTLKTGRQINVSNGIITNNQNLTLDGAVNLLNDITFRTVSGNLSFNNTIDGNVNLTLDAGTGTINLNGAVGSQTPLGDVTVTNAKNLTTGEIAAASLTQSAGTGTTTFNGQITTNGATGINITANTIAFTDSVTTTRNGPFTIANQENLAIASSLTLDGKFEQTGTGTVTISNDITTSNDDIRFTAPVTLMGEARLNLGMGVLAFGSTLDTGNNPLTLTAGEIDFNGLVTGTNTLTLQPATPTQNMTLGDATDSGESLDLTANELTQIQDGFTSITLGRADSSGEITIVNPLNFTDPVTLQAGLGTISVDGNLTGSNNAAIFLNAATIYLNSDLTTANNNINLTGNAILGNDIAIDTDIQGGDIGIVGNIDGNQNLTLNAGTGTINLNGNIGQTSPLSSLNVSSDSATLGGNITSEGNIAFDSSIAIAENLQLATSDGNITFSETVDSATNQAQNLTLSATNGNIAFNRAVGSVQPLDNLEIENAANLIAQEAIAVGGFRAVSSGSTTLQGNLTATAAAVDIQTANELTVADITANGQNVTLESQSGNLQTGNLDTSAGTTAGAIAVTSTEGEITTGNLTASGVTQGGEITVMAKLAITAGAIDSSATTGDAGNVFLDPIGDIEVASINAEGGTNGTGGDVFIETTGGFFRATDSFATTNSTTGFASISTAGGNGGGNIVIRHVGGDGGDPIAAFEIGNPTLNGTRDVITTGTSTLSRGESFPGSFSRGNISIQTDDPVPLSPIVPETLPIEDTPVTPETPIAAPPAIAPPPEIEPEPAIAAPPPEETPITPSSPPTIIFEPPVPSEPAIAPEPPTIIFESPIPSEPAIAPEPQATSTVEAFPDNGIERSLLRLEFPPKQMVISDSSAIEVNIDATVATLEAALTRQFEAYLNQPPITRIQSLKEIQQTLRETQQAIGIKTAVVYLTFGRNAISENAALICPNDNFAWEQSYSQDEENNRIINPETLDDRWLDLACDRHPKDPAELLVVTSEKPMQIEIPEASRELIKNLATQLRAELTHPRKLDSTSYLESAQRLYQLLIEPIESNLKAQGIQNLAFIPDAGLRSLPFAALHDGEKFLIENYSLALLPSFSLTQPSYANLRASRLLAMGSSTFTDLDPLPAVPIELDTITCTEKEVRNCWPGESFLNEQFTLKNLENKAIDGSFQIVHLATHADFKPGQPDNSYIRLWDTRLRLPQMESLKWKDSLVELLVLSACRTAFGDEEVELGFAGLAVQAGVKSAIASLWYVSDEGTLGLMSEFYHNLREAPIRAEALRRAQMAMIRGEIRLKSGQMINSYNAVELPTELSNLADKKLSHPYYWSGFITIGNPW